MAAATSAAVTQSRLDRLVTLLDSGSTPGIRATAARQLGQIAAVRVRGDASSSSSGAHDARRATEQDRLTSSVKREESWQEEEDEKPVASGSETRTASPPSSADAVRSTSTAQLYRGVEGEWDQAVFLIARVLPYLRSKVWDTRVAAAQAIEAICAAAGVWDPDVASDTHTASEVPSTSSASQSHETLLSFDTFSLPHVLSTGKKLLSSAGNEYDLPAYTSVEERLAHAKRDMQRLGLGSMGGVDLDLGVDVEQELMAGGGDTAAEPSTSRSSRSGTAAPFIEAPSPVATPAEEEIDMSKLSARERNQLKRKRKTEGKLGIVTGDARSKTRVVEDSAGSTPTTGLSIKTPSGVNGVGAPSDYLTVGSAKSNGNGRSPGTPNGGLGASSPAVNGGGTGDVTVTDAASLVVPSEQWPFTLICALLLSDLFSPVWEVRHGAALGLRELFKAQGAAGGKVVDGASIVKSEETAPVTNAHRHAHWCDDAAIRLLCVLTLDRLSDFVFDQVIAPVRETAGQALASLLRWMDDASFLHAHAVLLQMVKQDFLLPDGEPQSTLSSLPARRGVQGYAWEVRHAGLLGLRYEVSVRKDLLRRDIGKADSATADDVLQSVTHLAITCLRDDDDDVRSVAAATLLPIVDQIVEQMPDAVDTLLEQLWDSLALLKDDLSSSTGGVMDLLAKLVEKPDVVQRHFVDSTSASARPLSALIPLLYPFFRHTITSVRLAVINALLSFMAVPSLPAQEWIDEGFVRLVFQNLIVEERPAIREASARAWVQMLDGVAQKGEIATLLGPHVPCFFTILMTPLGTPFDFALFYRAASGIASRDKHNVDKGILAQDLSLVGVDAVIRGRLGAAEALGATLACWPKDADESSVAPLVNEYLTSSSALQQCLVSVVVQEWAERTTVKQGPTYDLVVSSPLAAQASVKLIQTLEGSPPSTYAEMVVMLQRIQRQCQALYTAFVRDGKVHKDRVPILPSAVDATGRSRDAFTLDSAKEVISSGFEGALANVSAKVKAVLKPALDERRAKLIAEVGFYQSIKEKQDRQIAASAAAATIALRVLPAKLNPVIRSVMNSVKFEENVDLQRRSGNAVTSLIELCQRPDARANPSDKIVKNLCAFVCQDATQTPVFARVKDQQAGILSLSEAETVAAASTTGRGRGRASLAEGDAGVALTEEEREGKNIRRGAEFALQATSKRFGGALFTALPVLWQSMTSALLNAFPANAAAGELDDATAQAVIDCCTLLQVIVCDVDPSLHGQFAQLLPSLTSAITSHYSVVRSMAAKTLAQLTDRMTHDAMLYVVQSVVPLLDDVKNVTHRQGAVETLTHIVRLLDLKLLPYVIVLIVPILGRMSDPDEAVRLTATNTFASLVKMVPLEAGLPDPPGFPAELMAKRQTERHFLAQLLDGSKVEPYKLPVEVKAELRSYQIDGVSWMAFLAKFHLHGVLCDDMGLGKTLQSICVVASKHFEQAARPRAPKLPSLIVCPPTLTGHWCHEIKQYATNLRPLLYAGNPTERTRLQLLVDKYDCVVASYDTVRNDIDALSRHDWLYCILDEGHIIKSAKTKTTKAVKLLRAQHRLILSGTPIQNNVLELWSLFDFLMPGFLGTERQFMDRFGRPILASRDAGKVTARDHERAALALEALHKQVLPFLLRRMKEDVLADLPPKIIQDIACDLSEVQRELYSNYLAQQNPDEFADATLLQDGATEGKQHVFQTLQYLRKLVCHPSMVFDATKASHRAIEQQLIKSGRKLSDIDNAPKLLALRQLLLDCGIGASEAAATQSEALTLGNDGGGGVSQHRVLIFCQQRQMLDIIENDLFRARMPGVTYMRLDGSIASPDKRFAIVQRFNADPSIDVLLLTTSVGGLGLTLTGADTVIFVEHDWNPMKDMQAMDRAHRLGQRKVVNVYRLITKDSLEEKIMGLQRFKMNVAGNIVNQQNKAMDSMETDQILDLFDAGKDGQDDAQPREGARGNAKGMSQKALLASLEGMDDTGNDYADLQQWSATT